MARKTKRKTTKLRLAPPRSRITHKKRRPIRRKRIMKKIRTSKILQRMAKPCHYTGKEPSPKGLGRCAHNEPFEGIVAKGRDGHAWITREVEVKSKGKVRRILRWVRV